MSHQKLRENRHTEAWYASVGERDKESGSSGNVRSPVLVPFLLTVLVLSGLTLHSSTRNSNYFFKDVEVGVGNPHSLWVGIGKIKTQFGYHAFCYDLRGFNRCSAYKDIELDSDLPDRMQLLGRMTFAGAIISIVLSACALVGLTAVRSSGGPGKGGSNLVIACSVLAAAYLLSVTVVAFPIEGMRMLHELGVEKATFFRAGWAYCMVVLETVLWIAIAVAVAVALAPRG